MPNKKKKKKNGMHMMPNGHMMKDSEMKKMMMSGYKNHKGRGK